MQTLSMSLFASLRLLRCAIKPATAYVGSRPVASFLGNPSFFHTSSRLNVLLSQKLSDVGEGTTEAQIIQWYVQEGAHVEELGNLCEVQTDKASVDITSRHTGVVKKLHYDADATVQVGQALLDIEVEGDAEIIDPEKTEVKDGATAGEEGEGEAKPDEEYHETHHKGDTSLANGRGEIRAAETPHSTSKHVSLATPAVRGLLKEHGVEIEDVNGTGKDGRVLKEDVQRFISEREARPAGPVQPTMRPLPSMGAKQVETTQRLTPVQSQMFRTMTASLSIPHFLYSDTINVTRLAAMRKSLNEKR